MYSIVGIVSLVGIVVNNGIVLVDYTNLLRKRGYSLEEACVEAARSRLRPILMTTLTTVLGLLPMAFFPGEGSEMTQPIGQSVLGGLSFSTAMTLFLMPVMYYIFNRIREKRAEERLRKVARKEGKSVHHRDDGLSAPSQVFLDLFLLLPSQDPSDDPLSAIAAEEEHQGRGQDDGSCGEEEGDQHVLRGLVVEEHVRKADREHRGDARDDVDDRGQEQEEDIGESLVLLGEVLEEGRDLSFSQEEVGEVGQKKDAEEDRDEDDQKAEEALPPSRRTFSLKQTLLVLCHGFPIIRDFPLFG